MVARFLVPDVSWNKHKYDSKFTNLIIIYLKFPYVQVKPINSQLILVPTGHIPLGVERW